MAKKPAFITNTAKNRKVSLTRPFKWGPGIPSLAITFEVLIMTLLSFTSN